MNREEIIKEVIDEIDKLKLTRLPVRACEATCISCSKCAQIYPTGVSSIIDAGASRISSSPGTKPAKVELAKYIDHTLLKPEATRDEIKKLCEEALQFGFASVCVNPCWVSFCADILRGSGVDVCTVIGFPLGATTTATKTSESNEALENGASELDMVINIGALKSGMMDYVFNDIKAVVDVAGKKKGIVKVIIETALLSDEEKVQASFISKLAGADFVKTSTGFSKGGATVGDVQLIRKVVGPEMGVKASGGIKDLPTLVQMIQSGATRIGASASVKIIKEMDKC